MATTENTQILGEQAGVKLLDRSAAFSVSYKIMFATLVAYCAIGAAVIAISSGRMLTNRWDNTFPEGPHVYAAMRTVRTGRLYSPSTESPYIVQSYGPLFYTINAAIAWASHLDVWLLVFRARLFCFLCYLFCGVFLFAISRKTGIGFALSLLASLMILGQPDFAFWSVTVRPDAPFLLAMLVSLYFAVCDESNDPRLLAASGFFTGLAFLIKQPGIAAGIAIFGVLAWNKQYRKAATFAVAAAVPVTIAFALLLWREPSFLAQYTSVGKAVWSLRDAFHFLYRRFFADGNALTRIVPFTIGMLGLARAAGGAGGRRMIAWFAVANWVVELSGLPQLGATMNYFLPGFAGFALLLPEALEFVREKARLATSAARFVSVMLIASVLLLLTTWLGYFTCKITTAFFRAPGEVSYEPLRPYRIISDRSLVALYGHDPELLDSFAVHSLELKNQWSAAPLLDNISREKYDLILMLRVDYKRVAPNYRGISDFSPATLDAINQKYVVLCSTMSSMILKPRDRDIALAPEYFGQMLDVQCGTGLSNKSPKLLLDKDSQ
jgi:hypothetical protein